MDIMTADERYEDLVVAFSDTGRSRLPDHAN
jgi:hypothetical protein